MPRISGGSPWLAAAGGLGEGLTGGLLTGMELAERRRRVEAERNRDTMALLMQGVKGMPEDPEQAAAYWQNFGQVFQGVTGQPLPPWNLGQVKPWADRLKDSVAQIKAATNLPDDQAFTYAFHLLTGGKGAPKVGSTTPHGVKWFNVPGQGYRSFAYGETPPPGSTPLVTTPEMVPYYTQTPGGIPEYRGDIPFRSKVAPIPPEEKETFPPEARNKRLTELQVLIKDPTIKKPQKDAAIAEWKALGGGATEIPAKGPWYWRTPADVELTRPEVKLKGGVPGFLGGGTPGGPLQFPRRVKVKGKVRTVNNQEEYNKAMEEAR